MKEDPMRSRTVCTVLACLALIAAPLVAQDTTTARKDTTGAKPAPDTTGARPAPDTTGARKDSIPVDSTGARKDTAAIVPPAADTTAAHGDTTAAVQPAAQPAADTTAPRPDTTASQAPDNSVRPGMTEAEVRARWGAPLATRTANDWTYLFYRNAHARRAGFEDVVFLQHGQVMDAIVRSPDHVYAGVSSSPEGRVPVFTPPQGQPADSTKGAAVTGVRVKPDQ
jgi:hypothetical protein